MRAALLTLICFTGIGATFYAPFLGIVIWHWLSLMSPHRYTYGFSGGLPVVAVSAVVTLIMWIASSEPKKLPSSWTCRMLIAFTVWATITTIFAASPEAAWEKWKEFIKILGMTLITIAVTTTRLRLIVLVWTAVISIGFWAFKGGLFSILTGGAHRVLGPPGTFMGDNNQFGLALVMTIPLTIVLSEIVTKRWIRLAILILSAFMTISALMTYSRGAALGLGAVAFMIWLSSRRRLLSALILIVIVVCGFQYLPDKWFARMDTIDEYETEGSAAQRLVYWEQGFNMARGSPLLGHGFKSFLNREIVDRYRIQTFSTKLQEAHSIYFQVMGEQGFFGFSIFILLLTAHLFSQYQIYRQTRKVESLIWASRLSRALILSAVAFAISGAFLSQAYFDFYYLIVAIGICLARIVYSGDMQPKGDRFPMFLHSLGLDAVSYGLTAPASSIRRTKAQTPERVANGSIADRAPERGVRAAG